MTTAVRGAWARIRRVLLVLLGLVAAALVAVVVLALVPVGTGGLDANPSPRVTEAAAASKLRYHRAAEGAVEPACRSRLLLPPRPTGRVVVLFHDLGSCPAQMTPLGRLLASEGVSVVAMRAPNHGLAGRDAGALGSLDAKELRDYADDSIDVAAGLGDDVTVLGIGLGGTLAAWAAGQRDEVDRAVVVAPALELGGVPGFVATAFTNVFARLPNVTLPADGARVPHAYPPKLASHAAAELFRLGKKALDDAEQSVPRARSLAVVENERDDSIANARADELVDAWQEHGRRVTVVRLPRSLGLDHDTVDPRQPTQRTDIVLPILVALAEGRTPPSPTP